MTTDILSTQVVINAIAVFVIQHVKESKWFPWLTVETSKLNRIAAIAIAGLATLGVNYSFDHTTGTLMITGLTLTGIGTALWNWIVSFVSQQIIFKATVSTKK